jgi:hypothetical protein
MSALRRSLTWITVGDAWTATLMACVLVYYLFTAGRWEGKHSGDGLYEFLYMKAMVFHQTLDMQSVIPERLPYFGKIGPGLHMPNRWPIGPVAVWLPLYLLALGGEWAARAVGAVPSIKNFGATSAEAYIAGLGTLLAVFVGWRSLFALAERHFERASARWGAALAVAATPLLWYACEQPFYQHGIAFGAAALLVERWEATRGRAELRRFIGLGALGGYAATVRAQEVVWLLPLGLEILHALATRATERRRWLVGGVAGAAAAIVAFVPQMLVWRYYTGGLLSPPQGEHLRLGEPFFLMVLFSSRGGLFAWTPLAYAALAGLALLAVAPDRFGRDPRATRAVAAALLVAWLADLYICAAAWTPWAGTSFGARRLSDGAVLLGFAVAALLSRLRRPSARALAVGFLAFTLAYNVFLVELFRRGRIASAGSGARSFASELAGRGAPRWLVRAAETVGYPFAQPAGWLFALVHRARPVTFEAVVGDLVLDRDPQFFQLQNPIYLFDAAKRYHLLEGLRLVSDKGPAEVTGPARLLVYLFAREPFTLDINGQIPEGPTALRWNGEPVAVTRTASGLRANVPLGAARAGTNTVELDLPVGARLAHLRFTPTSRWEPIYRLTR